MPRQVDLRLEALLQEQAPETSKTELADRLGISDATLRSYLENRWTVLDRTVLERMADFFQCDAGSLLATRESPFFEPFQRLSGAELFANSPTCVYLIRPDANVMSGGRSVAYRDHQAIDRVGTLLREHVDGLKEWETSAASPNAFKDALRQNCVILGSPFFNPATEMALCRAFGLEPFTPASRAQLPFTFRVAEPQPQSTVLEHSPDGRQGIWHREYDELIERDYWPENEFKRRRIDRGRDAAVVLVASHAPGGEPGNLRKLIVLAGVGGAGTEAAAMALAGHYRDLEPFRTGETVWGLLEVFYRKGPHTKERKNLTYNWRWRAGGRCPVNFVSRPVRT
jgi:hypothetical protein